MNISLIQNSPKLKKMSLSKFEQELTKIEGDLVIFPELALNGYLLEDAVLEDTFRLNEIEEFAKLSASRSIVFGFILEKEKKFYNCVAYCSLGKIVHIHSKTTLPNYGLFQEARFFTSGKNIESFETNYGRVLMVICEEMFDLKVIEKITFLKPQFLIVLANSPARGFEGKDLSIERQWNSILTTCAISSGASIFFVNRVGFEDGLGFWGGSCHIDPSGKVLKKAKLFEKEVLCLNYNNTH